MKTKNFKKPIALFLAVVLCAAMLFSLGTTAFAAGGTEDVCLIAFPRDGDENYSGEWGHGNLNFMNGWSTKASAFTLIRAMGQYSGNICYCIEPGVSQQPGDSLTKKGEDFWDNYPAAYNKTISPEDIKLLIGRIFQYGYTGPISVSWRSQNDGGDKLAHAVATQLLIWETVVGERDADFNKIGTNGKDAIVDQISTNHPLYGQIMGYYSSIAANVQYHSSIPSFLAKTAAEAQSASLEWDGEAYAVTLTDKNGVLSDYSFSSPNPDIKFSVKGNELTISTGNMLNELVAITAEKSNSRRSGIITWTDGVYGPNGKLQDTVTYPENEFGALAAALGKETATVIHMAAGGKDRLNAMYMVDGYGENNPIVEKSQFIMSLVEQIDKAGVGPQQKSIIDRCTALVYQDAERTGKPAALCDLRNKLLEQPEEKAKEIALSLELFTTGSLDIFGHESTVDLDKRIVVFDIHGLGEQLKPTGLLVITDTILNRVTLNWKKGKRTHIFIDEFHVVFENEQSGIFFNSAWRQFRKRNGYPTAITQNVEYLLDSVQASTMLSNSEFVVMLNQAFSDRAKLSKLLNISDEQMSYVTNADAGCGLIKYGSALVPFINRFPKDTELYRLMTTRPGEGVFGSGNAS